MRYVRVGTLYEAGLQELAVALLKHEVRAATWSQISLDRRQEALAFIRGSGLETVLELFDLPTTADAFRTNFARCLSLSVVWSSATIGVTSS